MWGWASALVALAFACPAMAETRITAAQLSLPTDRYDHAILGDGVEWGGLDLTVEEGGQTKTLRITLPESRVFEDITARLADVTGDGAAEVIVVETDIAPGASLAVYGPKGKLAATPPIGQTHRWLAPAAIADFDGDGVQDIAYVDRPHLLRELVFVRLSGGNLQEFSRLPGLTNHRIGDKSITSTTRDCGTGPEVLLPNADWTRLMAATPNGAQDIGPYNKPAMAKAKSCP